MAFSDHASNTGHPKHHRGKAPLIAESSELHVQESLYVEADCFPEFDECAFKDDMEEMEHYMVAQTLGLARAKEILLSKAREIVS
ncbi:hypothetical protein AMTR_s00096p00152180 [Amborella trichopoda]|uniref:Uncharacterized protein n=1 Tax=Amborella trichopoda TaxID=13333 RepID=W1P4B5_AMBTC|nr:hypothetical protein AMTR_s00096p00152180 [Amborella trichopoda]